MCTFDPLPTESEMRAMVGRSSAIVLADEMRRALGVDVDADKLHAFIVTRWSRISVLAHAIHDESEQAKGAANQPRLYDEGMWAAGVPSFVRGACD